MARIDPGPATDPTGANPASNLGAPVEPLEDLTAAPEGSAALVPPEILAQTLREYVRGQFLRIRGGESGVLPVLLGLVAIVIVFQAISPHHVFLSAGNIVNLFQQSAVFMVLAMAEIFVLLLGEIDLSIGYVGPVGAVIAVQLVQPVHDELAVVGGHRRRARGLRPHRIRSRASLVTRLRLPSFIVTLAGLLIFNGVLLIVLAFGPFSGIPQPPRQVIESARALRPHVGPRHAARGLDRRGSHRGAAEPEPLSP